MIQASAKTRPDVGLRATAASVSITAADAAAKSPPRFSISGYTGGLLDLGYPWSTPVVVDLASIDLTDQRIPALYDHCKWELNYLVGQTDSIQLAGGELLFTGVIAIRDTGDRDNYAQQIVDLAKAGVQLQASIGGNPGKVEEIPTGQSVEVNGRTFAGPVAVARNLSLREISFVILGADRHTSAAVTARQPSKKLKARGKPGRIQGAAMTFEEWLAKMGWTTEEQSALDEVKKANLMEKYRAEYPEEGDGTETPTNADDGTDEDDKVTADGETEPVEDDEEETPAPTNAGARKPRIQAKKGFRPGQTPESIQAAERTRVQGIVAICAEHKDLKIKLKDGRKVKLSAHAIAAGWSLDRVKARLLEAKRENRPKGPTVMARQPNDSGVGIAALQSAMILRLGGKLDHKAYGSIQARQHVRVPQILTAGINDPTRNRVMEAAHQYSDLSLVDMARESLRLAGKQAPHNREDMIQAAFSGSNFGTIFTSSVNAVLLASYMEATDTTLTWTTTTEVPDFKTNDRPRVEVGPGLEKLPRGGEAEHAKYSDTNESYKIARYSKQFQIDEQDVIDDRLGALADIPTKFGAAAARLRPDLVYAILLANRTLATTGRALFNSTDGNTATGAALAADKLRAAIQVMMAFRENGVNLNLVPSHILVPTDLFMLAKELITSATIIVAGTSDTTRGSANVVSDMNIQIVCDARLNNGVTDPDTKTAYSGSSSTWYLGSTLAHTIEVAYRRGTGQAPRVRSFQLERGQYGVGWDVAMDIGAKELDWKGLLRRQQ